MNLSDSSVLELARPRLLSEIAGNQHAKDVVSGLLTFGAIKPGLVFHGDIGTGKSTIARVTARAIVCGNRQGIEPCGSCDACAYSPRHTALWGEGITVRNCAGYSACQLEEDTNDGHYAFGSPVVLVLDEFHRAPPKLFEPLLTILEDDTLNLVVLLTTSELAKVDRALAQRLHIVKMAPPAPKEALAYLQRTRDRLGLVATDEELEAICSRTSNVLRDCLKQLQVAHALHVVRHSDRTAP